MQSSLQFPLGRLRKDPYAVFQRGIRKSFGSYESLIVESKIAVLKTYSSIKAWVLYG